MKKSRFTESQVSSILKEYDGGSKMAKSMEMKGITTSGIATISNALCYWDLKG